MSITATLVDVFGNPVNGGSGASTFAYTYTGPGLQVGTAPTEFSATTGAAKVGALLGANDSGSIVVTFTYDADGVGTTYAAITATKTIIIGTEGNVGALKSWTKKLNDGTVKMYAKNIVGAGKVQFMLNGEEIAWVRAANTSDSKLRLAGAEGAAYLVRTVDLVKGQKNVLLIFVDGVQTTRTAYTY